MDNDNIDEVSQWVSDYYKGYEKYMQKYHSEIFFRFIQNIHPPHRIGGGINIGKSAKNTNEDHAEILRISKEFSDKYPNPIDFPKEF